VTDKRAQPKGKVINIIERHRQTVDISKFIDAHGGRLGAFRGYGMKPPTPPTTPS
jgi:hypothetical protein